MANLANNHSRDYGSDALVDTVEWLEAAGVVTVGAGENLEEAHRYRVLVTEGGVKVAFVGASLIVPAGFGARSASAGIASAHLSERARVLDSVRDASVEADAVIVNVHWGIERDTCPSEQQELLARELLAAGADVVIGHHPHVLQPVEFADGKLVAYSLGNFVWHPRDRTTRRDRRAAGRLRRRRDHRLVIPPASTAGRQRGTGPRGLGRQGRQDSRHHRRRLRATRSAAACLRDHDSACGIHDHHDHHDHHDPAAAYRHCWSWQAE